MGFQIMNLIGNWLNSKGLYRLVSRVTKGEWWGAFAGVPDSPRALPLVPPALFWGQIPTLWV